MIFWIGAEIFKEEIFKEAKKHLRVIKYNEMKSTEYEPPQFDVETGTFDAEKFDWSRLDDIEKPLIPAKTQKDRKLFIR